MIKVQKLDHYGRGIIKENGKVTFIPNALPNEEIEYKVQKENNKYNEGFVTKYINKSKDRIEPYCPFYNSCGGCALQHLSYDKTLEFKTKKVENILSKYASININTQVIKNENIYNYRNKVSLKVKDGKYGFYSQNTHQLIQINECKIASYAINSFIKDLKYLDIKNGSITIRSNYNNELMIIINSDEKPSIDIDYLKKHHKIVGVIFNNKILYGDDKYIEIIDDYLFQVSYDSFFQINRYITSKIFNIVSNQISKDSVVVDLFCGVGTLSTVASKKALKVYGIEIVPNAIKNALVNKKINKTENIEFMLGNANDLVSKINEKVDTIIIDPPRCGLSKSGVEAILGIMPKDIIYISCDPMTLARDLNILKDSYNVKELYVADMFSYTFHVECVCVLKLK